MIVKGLNIQNFRNIENAYIEPTDGVNVIFGENAQGKTNLLESIWLFTGCKSFRCRRDREMVGFDAPFAKNEMTFFAKGREQTAHLFIDQKRTAMKNGVTLKSLRRRFLDTALCELKPQYAKALAKYNHTLNQRNALLKDIQYHPELFDTLDVWDEKISSYGAAVVSERVWYTNLLSGKSAEIYDGLSDSKEKLKINYVSNFGGYEGDPYAVKEMLKQQLLDSRREDIFNKMTTAGPHRDDLQIQIDSLSARTFGSQGQQRSAALAMKLSEASILRDQTGEEPVILLDDVMSELDENRQDYILNHISGRQVFITCCDPTTVLRLCEGRTFHMEKGRVL